MRKVKVKVDGVTKMMTIEERDRLLARGPNDCSEAEIIRQLQQRVSTMETELQETRITRDQFERWYQDTMAKNRAFAEETGKLKETSRVAHIEAMTARHERDALMRRLSFAEGFISALKGEPYPNAPDGPIQPIDMPIDMTSLAGRDWRS